MPFNLVAERLEIFDGDETGSTNITALREWLIKSNRQPELSGMETWNVKELLDAHEWDNDKDERVRKIFMNMGNTGEIEPLIMIKSNDGSGFVIDGWHRLFLIYTMMIALVPDIKVIKFSSWMVTQSEANKFPAPKMRKIKL